MNIKSWAGILAALISLATVVSGQTTTSQEVLTLDKIVVTEMKGFSDQAIPEVTPVSFSEIGKETIAAELGSRDIPLVLNSTPSVFSTTDSGGAGDARVNVRGFSQRNVSILINGVPTNDIENGWLYWSNWDGLGDVTSTIQVQRGLSNVTLPTPSIGGTMNIITDPASSRAGISAKVEGGSDGFLKGTVVANTGLRQGKYALTVGLVRKVGDGYARGTFTDGWGYYFGAMWKLSERNRLELFAIGAPQRHGQRTFASNIAAYDAAYAKSLGYSDAEVASAISRGPVNSGEAFNPNFAPVSRNYSGRQYFWGGTHARYDAGFINERENYFHKPQVNLNWYSKISDDLRLDSVFYYSGGRGGGSGTLYNTAPIYGFQSSSRAFAFVANTDPLYGSAYNWDATIAANAGTTTVRGDRTKPAGQSLAILRNSVNNQDQFGIVSKLGYQLSPAVKVTAGIDWRTATIDHFREVRDLMGGSYYVPSDTQVSEFNPDGTNAHLGLGDKVDYYNTNTVDWLGLFLQGQYEAGPVSAFAVYGASSVDYSYVDHFRKAANGTSEFELNPSADSGQQIKGGIQYAFDSGLKVFGNAGWVSKVPVFDGVINDINGVLVNTSNETFKSIEGGVRYTTPDRKFNVSASYYFTQWRDRTVSSVNAQADTVTYLRGVNSDYSGIEIEGAWMPARWIRFDAAASLASWTYQSDVASQVFDLGSGAELPSAGLIYIKGLKVGDAPQTQFAYSTTVYPTRGLSIKLEGRSYSRYWSDYQPETRQDATDRAQPWQIPNYQVYDLHLNYRLPNASRKYDITLFAHFFNLFDKTYVSDATDNSSFEAITTAPLHTAQRAEVFLGAPATYNFGVKVTF